MGFDPHQDKEIARRSTPLSSFAPSGQAQALPIINPGRDFHIDRPHLALRTGAMAHRTWSGEGFPLATTAAAGPSTRHLTEGRLLHETNLTAPVTLGTGRNGSTGLSLVAMAMITDFGARNGNLLLSTKGRFLKLNGHFVTEISPPLGAVGLASAKPSENFTK